MSASSAHSRKVSRTTLGAESRSQWNLLLQEEVKRSKQIFRRDIRKEMITAMSLFSFTLNVVLAKHSHRNKETQKNSTMLAGHYRKILIHFRRIPCYLNTLLFNWYCSKKLIKRRCFIFTILLCGNISASTSLSCLSFQWKSFVSHWSYWHSETFGKTLNRISGSFRKPAWGSFTAHGTRLKPYILKVKRWYTKEHILMRPMPLTNIFHLKLCKKMVSNHNIIKWQHLNRFYRENACTHKKYEVQQFTNVQVELKHTTLQFKKHNT